MCSCACDVCKQLFIISAIIWHVQAAVHYFSNNEQLLDTATCVEEIEAALKILKLGKSAGPNGLFPEHIVCGGGVLKLWLKKISIALLHSRNFQTL